MECDAYPDDIDVDLDKFTTFGFDLADIDVDLDEFTTFDFDLAYFGVDEFAEIATSIEPVLDEVPCSRPDCPGKVIFPDTCKTCSKCRETGRKYKQRKKGKSGDTIAKFAPVMLATVPAMLATVPAMLATVPAMLATVPAMLETVPANGGGRAKPKRVHNKRDLIHKCPACGVGHRCPAELATHNKVCKGKSKKGKFRNNHCVVCDKDFRKPSYLTKHEKGPNCKARTKKWNAGISFSL
jgi:hypothetical protein